jgi:hypothetical protein
VGITPHRLQGKELEGNSKDWDWVEQNGSAEGRDWLTVQGGRVDVYSFNLDMNSFCKEKRKSSLINSSVALPMELKKTWEKGKCHDDQ